MDIWVLGEESAERDRQEGARRTGRRVLPQHERGARARGVAVEMSPDRDALVRSMKIPGAMFCTPTCYRDNCKPSSEELRLVFCGFADLSSLDKTHKKLHKVADPGQYVFPEGSESRPSSTLRVFVPSSPPSSTPPAKEGFNGKYTYTGPLRAVYPIEPVPKRVVPDTVTYPDYAKECETLLSIPERWSAVWGGSVLGKAEEIGRTIHWGLRDAVSFGC
jgi:methionyl aminopeptidase